MPKKSSLDAKIEQKRFETIFVRFEIPALHFCSQKSVPVFNQTRVKRKCQNLICIGALRSVLKRLTPKFTGPQLDLNFEGQERWSKVERHTLCSEGHGFESSWLTP